MKTKTIASLALVILLGLVSLPDAASALKVTPGNHRGVLTRCQEEELLPILLSQHPQDPGLAYKVFAQAIIIDPRGADKLKLIIKEDDPGEILPCTAIVLQGGAVNAVMETNSGDGSFEGPPSVFRGCGFQLMMFHGTPSTRVPLKLELRLEFLDRKELTDCIDQAKDQFRHQLAQCDSLPPNDQEACRQSALDQYRANADRCHHAPGPAVPQVVFRSFTIPPGHQIIQFSTGARPPLNDLRFIASGDPDLKISSIVGTNQGLPQINFNPPATPFEVTINSGQRPLFNCPSSDFLFSVENTGTRDHVLNLGAIYR